MVLNLVENCPENFQTMKNRVPFKRRLTKRNVAQSRIVAQENADMNAGTEEHTGSLPISTGADNSKKTF